MEKVEEEERITYLPSFCFKLKEIGESKFDILIIWAHELKVALPRHLPFAT